MNHKTFKYISTKNNYESSIYSIWNKNNHYVDFISNPVSSTQVIELFRYDLRHEQANIMIQNLTKDQYVKFKKFAPVRFEISPPLPKVTSNSIKIPVTQSSYCWGTLGCADYIGWKMLLEGQNPTVVSPTAAVKVSFDYKPAPYQIMVQQFQETDCNMKCDNC